MKKYFISIGLVIVFGAYAFLVRHNNNSSTELPTTTSTPIAPTTTTTTTTTTPDTAATTPTAPTVSSGYKDGSYTGSLEDAFYGNIQVKATISGGKLTNVSFLSYPNDRDNSIEINNYAIPLLKTEAIQAQIANVDIVSGATATSTAFRSSLQTALQKAQ